MSLENLNPGDYGFLRELLDREVGISLEDGKEYLAVTRLEPVRRKHDLADLGVLVERLRKHDRVIKGDVIDAMTVNETLFFRDPNVWRSLRENLLPELITEQSGSRTMRLWSAACSSGQEPYSLSIVLSELLGKEDASWDIKISASDLSTEMVSRTKAGVFSNYEVSRGMDPETRDRYFIQHGDKWRVNDRMRSRVETRQANLSNLPPNLGPFDLIMLRNVLIYFSAETRESVLRQMAKMLSPKGCLLLGASEGAVGVPSVLTPVRMNGLVAFRRSDSANDLDGATGQGSQGGVRPGASGGRAPAVSTTRGRRAEGSRPPSSPLASRRASDRSTVAPGGVRRQDSASKENRTARRSGVVSPRPRERESERVGASSGATKRVPVGSRAGEPTALERLRALRDERERRGG